MIIIEDNGSSFASELYKFCFINGELITNSGIAFINKRLEKVKKLQGKDFITQDLNSFTNQAINWFKINHPELLKGNKQQTFKTTIINLCKKYFSERNLLKENYNYFSY